MDFYGCGIIFKEYKVKEFVTRFYSNQLTLKNSINGNFFKASHAKDD